jgi:hypothetical protein
VNGVTVQDATTADMIFSVAKIVSFAPDPPLATRKRPRPIGRGTRRALLAGARQGQPREEGFQK